MGTRGLWAYRFRGRYYIQYSNNDSYPDGLGAELVKNIPVDPREYQAWKARIIDKYNKLEERLKREGQLLPEYEYEPSYLPPMNDVYIEWTYVVDLDRDIFTVNETAHFKMQHIPQPTTSWASTILIPKGDSRRRKIISEDFPKEFIGNINTPKPETKPEHIELYRSSDPTISEGIISIMDGVNKTFEQLTKRLFIDFIAYYAFYLDELYQWSPQDEPFQQIAFAIICLACGCHTGYNFIEATGEQAKKLGKDRVPRWEYPNGDRYWLPNGVWVLLKTHLDDDLQVESAVGEVIAKARDDSLGFDKPFTAIIFSIEHVVLVTVSQGGKEISRTGAPQAYLNIGDDLDEHGCPGFGKRQPKPAKSIDGFELFPGFHAMLKHFACRSSGIEDVVNQTRLPVEIISRIFEYIVPSTRRAFSTTSRLFQQVARKNPILGQYILERNIQETEFLAMDTEGGQVVKLDILNKWQKTPYPIIGVCLNYGRQNCMGMFHYFLKAG